jgi:hypothetical protein
LSTQKENKNPNPNPIAREKKEYNALLHPFTVDQYHWYKMKIENTTIVGMLVFTASYEMIM